MKPGRETEATGKRYKVAIRDNATGETRIRDMGDLPWLDHTLYWWTEGNFGCDCNRHMEFIRAKDDSESDMDHECGDSAYSVLHAEFDDGSQLTIDGE